MKILFDHEIFSKQRYGGISRYFANIYHTLQNTDNHEARISTFCTHNYYIDEINSGVGRFLGNTLLKKERRNYRWNKRYSKYLISKNEFDVFHPTYFNTYFLKHLNKPFVLTVHDMIYEIFPEYFPSHDPLPYHKRILMNKAEKIIAISETTKADILRYSDVTENKIEVIHHGIDFNPLEYQNVPNLPEEYILFVGERTQYKNFHIVASAFKEISLKYPNLKLVLAGGGPIKYGDSEFLMRNKILEKTIQISATDKQLNTIYKNAICFVYPSLYEGFGLPILEAFKNNCPVLLSNCSCFEEIAGNAAAYFEAKSLQSLATKIEQMIEDAAFRKQMIALGSNKVLEYPIDDCISKTINLYKSI
ncbi:glycosyltransferase family 4 protein [Pedobacter helvus]|uniref:Glycosyltransferase family 4 protein n=1 Tax=Pedobacter helvus TaxID=2563444 RepID=A0ABW9JHB0_9SPHI|nr:glycosyltransferase family 1 protein [Pedobacter ureilyticus]